MNLNNLESYEEFGQVRVDVAKSSRSYGRSSKQFRIFDSSHNISQILKFLPFYERLGLRVVNSKWNLSFYFSECWETLDYRFFDLASHEFYLSNFKRFIANVKKLDICINQISKLNKLICSSHSSDYKCVNSISDSNSESGSDCTIDSLDIIETDNECQSGTEFGHLNPCSNDASDKYCNVHTNENTAEDLKNILKTLRNLGNLQISDISNSHNNIFIRVHPTLIKFIESQVFSTNSPRPSDLTTRCLTYSIIRDSGLLDSYFQPCGLHTLVIDAPIDVHFILQITPFVKNIRNLVISRVRDHSSICSVIAEVLEHIPRNQLLSLQIGRTIFDDSHRDVEFSTSARARRFNRLNFAYKSFGTTNLEEGDEIISVLLSNQIDSLRIIILDDIEISLPAYRQISSFKNLSYSKIYTWSNVSNLFSPDAF